MRFLAVLALVPTLAFAQVEQGPANADFRPAFVGQTRAPALPATRLRVEAFTTGLERPWGIARLPSGQFLVTERGGTMKLVGADGTVQGTIGGVPRVWANGQGGLLDVAVSPRFSEDRLVFWTYAKPVSGGAVTAAARGVLGADGQLGEVRDIFVQSDPGDAGQHFGSRIVVRGDGTVFITTGDRTRQELPQDPASTVGKVIRLTWDGQVPADNPFAGGGGDPAIWSLGHRNMQGATLGPDGALWTIEHGPRGGDELNRPQAGRNYGWPVISYGINYNGQNIGQGIAVRDGMEQPVYYWDPVIAPGGMAFYDGTYAPWRGDLLIGSLNPGALVRLKMQGGRVVGEERLIDDAGRIRDVEVLPDGSVLVLKDAGWESILRLTPQ